MNESKIALFLLALLLPTRIATFFTESARKKREVSERNRRAREKQQEEEFFNSIVVNGRAVLGARGPGFFSEFLSVLNWLRWAREGSVTLKVLWDEKFRYSDGKNNYWNSFFDPFWNEMIFTGTEKTVRVHLPQRDHFVFSHAPKGGAVRFSRSAGCELVKNYIRVKAEIVETVDDFYRKHFLNRHVIAIHLRSAEKDSEGVQVPPPVLIDLANNLKRSNTTFFVLTDVQECLEYARLTLEGPVVATDCLRVDDRTEAVHLNYPGNLNIAREALIDALIAARADTFLFTTSNLAFSVLTFNSELRGISVRFNAQGQIEYYDYSRNTNQMVVSSSWEEIIESSRHD